MDHGGYDYAEPRRLAAEFGFTLHLHTRGEEVQDKRHAKGKARRWAEPARGPRPRSGIGWLVEGVEASHSWTNRFRDLLIRWSRKPENYLALTHFASGIIASRQCLPG